MIMGIQTSKSVTLLEEVRTLCTKHPSWYTCVSKANTAEAFSNIITHMIETCEKKQSHALVLRVYTEAVCNLYVHISEDIWKIYEEIISIFFPNIVI